MSVIAGLKTENGYLFFTGSIICDERNGGIIKLNGFCGALIVTKRENELKRVRELLSKYPGNNAGSSDGMSENLIRGLVSFLKAEFKNNTSYKSRPLPFLMLIVGANMERQGLIEHVFLRNRITEAIDKNNSREFITAIDINPPMPAGNLFYGESNIIEYLAKQIRCDRLSMDEAKVLAFLSLTGLPPKSSESSADANVAQLSVESGFTMASSEEISLLKDRALKANSIIMRGLNNFLSEKNTVTGHIKDRL